MVSVLHSKWQEKRLLEVGVENIPSRGWSPDVYGFRKSSTSTEPIRTAGYNLDAVLHRVAITEIGE